VREAAVPYGRVMDDAFSFRNESLHGPFGGPFAGADPLSLAGIGEVPT
jgi:hypothetical protein